MWQQNSLECFSAAWCIAKVINWDKARITSSKEARWKELSHFWAAAAKLPYLPTTKIKYISNMYQSMYLEDSPCTFLDSLLPFFLKRTKIKGQIRKRKKKGTQESPGIYIYTWNPNDPCFDWRRPCFGGLTFKNRGHCGSRYIFTKIYKYNYRTITIRVWPWIQKVTDIGMLQISKTNWAISNMFRGSCKGLVWSYIYI